MPSGPAKLLHVLRINLKKASKEGSVSSTEIGALEWASKEQVLDMQMGLASKVPDQHL